MLQKNVRRRTEMFAFGHAAGRKNWLLLRVWIFGLVRGHFVAEKTISAYGNQGPGSGMGYLAAMIFVFFWLLVGTVFIKIRF
jgi:hypothetical protein